MLGLGALGELALGEGPRLSAKFEPEREFNGQSLIQVIPFVDRELIRRFGQFPDELRLIDRRRFEEVIAEIWAGFGYAVELTQRTRDGGRDIVPIKRLEANLKFLIECKRPDPGNPVRIAAVRELLGVKHDEGASKAILVTTTASLPMRDCSLKEISGSLKRETFRV
jgi:hypothetical protein